jgi:hypothetical protein
VLNKKGELIREAGSATAVSAAAESSAPASTVSTPTPTPTPFPFFLGAGLTDNQVPFHKTLAVEHLDRLLGIFGRTHLDEAEPPRAPCLTVGDNLYGSDHSRRYEQIIDLFLCNLIRKITDIQLSAHPILL